MKMLLIEDDKYKCDDIKKNVQKHFPDLEVDVVKSYKAGVMGSLYGDYDLLLIDMTIPIYDSDDISNNGGSLKNGGELIVNEVYDEGKTIKFAIVTQYETFDGETLEAVEQRLYRLCGDNYLGSVKYCSYKEDWKEPLNNIIDNVIHINHR
jgi:hypothetical protein